LSWLTIATGSTPWDGMFVIAARLKFRRKRERGRAFSCKRQTGGPVLLFALGKELIR
jgi:hypothetical protein